MKYRVAWLAIFACLAIGVYVPGMWPAVLFGFILTFFVSGMKPIERKTRSSDAGERAAARGCAVTWLLLTLALTGAAVAAIVALGGGQ